MTASSRSKKTAPKLLALLMLGLASMGTTGCEHPLSTLFNAQGETARAAMEQQTALMQQILEDQRAREEGLMARLDELENQGDEDSVGDDEAEDGTGDSDELEDGAEDDEDELDVAEAVDDEDDEDEDDGEGEPGGGGIGIEQDSLAD